MEKIRRCSCRSSPKRVLRHRVGSDKVMYDQLLHLINVTEHENVIVQVVPPNSSACAGFSGAFVIASLDGDEVGYVDNPLTGDTIESVAGVAQLRRFFDIFRAGVLNQQDSTGLIRRVAEEWNDQAWRKSIRSSANGGDCVELAVVEPDEATGI